MGKILNIDILKDKHKNKYHDVGDVAHILPFTVNPDKEIRDHFNIIIGDFVRNICELNPISLSNETQNEQPSVEDPLITQIIRKIEYEPEIKADLERIVKHFLYNEDYKVNIFHPYMFNFMPQPKKSLRKYSKFLVDVFVQNNHEIKNLFLNKEAEDLLSDLILNAINIEESKISKKAEYQSVFNVLSNYFQEDLLYIKNYKEYFLKNFGLLTHFYTLMYICQLFVKFEQFINADYSKITPLYFALEWEPLNKRRKAVDEHEGFKFIKNRYNRLFVHIHTLSQLSNNKHSNPSESGKPLRFFTYNELYDQFNTAPLEIRTQFINDINEWIVEYSQIFNKRVKTKGNISNLEDGFKLLFQCVSEGTNEEAAFKYGKNIENIAGSTFLKARGNLGTVFNMNHDMLILLTAVCIKDRRLPLKTLFEEYENRGVIFDRYSKKAIVELLDSYNILDKKSDSGDAQYVKPIL